MFLRGFLSKIELIALPAKYCEANMGRQVSFHLHPDDRELLAAWLAKRHLRIVQATANSHPFEVFDCVPESANHAKTSLVICSKHDTGTFNCIFRRKSGEFQILPSQNPVVEFAPSVIVGTRLYPGRFWYVPRDFPPDFNSWANALLRWIRCSFERLAVHYASPTAVTWSKNGGELVDSWYELSAKA